MCVFVCVWDPKDKMLKVNGNKEKGGNFFYILEFFRGWYFGWIERVGSWGGRTLREGQKVSCWMVFFYWIQQHPPDLLPSTGRPVSIFTLLAVSVALDGGPTRFLISAAIVINACSTFVAFLADVSRKGMPN